MAGKSTLVKLLMRLYDADSGQILANNKDIKVYNGAGFIVVYMGNVLLMPGMPKNPNYLNM